MGKRKPETGDLVSIRSGTYDDDPWVDARIDDLLSVQFTCIAEITRPDGGVVERVLFGFYCNENVDWKFAK